MDELQLTMIGKYVIIGLHYNASVAVQYRREIEIGFFLRVPEAFNGSL